MLGSPHPSLSLLARWLLASGLVGEDLPTRHPPPPWQPQGQLSLRSTCRCLRRTQSRPPTGPPPPLPPGPERGSDRAATRVLEATNSSGSRDGTTPRQERTPALKGGSPLPLARPRPWPCRMTYPGCLSPGTHRGQRAVRPGSGSRCPGAWGAVPGARRWAGRSCLARWGQEPAGRHL